MALCTLQLSDVAPHSGVRRWRMATCAGVRSYVCFRVYGPATSGPKGPVPRANQTRRLEHFGWHLEANDQKFGLCQRLVSSADQYPFIFPLNCGQRLDTDRQIEINLFGRSEQLVWTSKQSSDRPTKIIRHVKYFGRSGVYFHHRE